MRSTLVLLALSIACTPILPTDTTPDGTAGGSDASSSETTALASSDGESSTGSTDATSSSSDDAPLSSSSDDDDTSSEASAGDGDESSTTANDPMCICDAFGPPGLFAPTTCADGCACCDYDGDGQPDAEPVRLVCF